MKKIAIILSLALCLWVLAACGQPTVQSGGATPAPEQETAEVGEDSGTDLYLPGDAGYEDDSATDAEDASAADTDWTALDPEDCVEDLAPFEGMVPHITLDCPGADEINGQIQDVFVTLADDPECQGLYYLCGKGAGRVLSVVMVQQGPNDTIFFTPYNLDLATGEALDSEELLSLLEVDVDELKNLEQAIMGDAFVHLYGDGSNQQDRTFYDEQYQRTTAPDNTEVECIWLAGDGQLTFAGRIYSLAGAEYYLNALGTGLIF